MEKVITTSITYIVTKTANRVYTQVVEAGTISDLVIIFFFKQKTAYEITV